MSRFGPLSAALTLASLVVVVALTACGRDAKTTASPTAGTGYVGTSVAHYADALPPPVAETVRLVLSASPNGVIDRLRFTREPCVRLQQVGSPPPCRTEEAEGAVVEGFLVVSCDGGPQRRDVAERIVRGLLDPSLALFAVYHPLSGPNRDQRFHLLFRRSDAGAAPGVWFEASADGSITSAGSTCASVTDTVKPVSEFLVPPN